MKKSVLFSRLDRRYYDTLGGVVSFLKKLSKKVLTPILGADIICRAPQKGRQTLDLEN